MKLVKTVKTLLSHAFEKNHIKWYQENLEINDIYIVIKNCKRH